MIKNNWEWQTDNELQLFEITLNIEFFKKYAQREDYYIEKFMNAIENKTPSLLSADNLTITPEILDIINKIIDCKRDGIYKEMFLESKIIQLLLLQLEQICCNSIKQKLNVKKMDLLKMYEVRDIILSDLKKPFLLKELANQVGTNEFTLKKSFKIIFGTSVFRYLNEIKMQKAQSMLLQQNLTIKQVSELIGYKNATHFTTAYKKKYGILPSMIKK